MPTSCIRQTELPHATKLFSDFTYHPDRVAEFYHYLPVNEQSFQRAADELDFDQRRREGLIEALSIDNTGNPLLERLRKPGTVAVVTGQQVGLFSGPAYTIYKALTAIRLAARLTESGIEAVPVFWLATEDHDLNEVNHSWIFGADYQPQFLEAGVEARQNQPVGGVTLTTVPIEGLAATLKGLPFAEETIDLVRTAYQPGMALGAAFSRLMEGLLRGFPILRVDPMLPQFRQLAAPLLREAVLRAPDLLRRIRDRDQELAAAGYHAQVHIEESTSLFFLLKNGQRLALKRQNGNYLSGTHKFSAEELADLSTDLSPNALLRPVVQDSMIPTIAYVGGPSEISYLAQSEVIYREILGRQPIAVHRSGFTLMNEHDRKTMDRYLLNLPDFFHGEDALRERAARTLADPRITARVAEARESVLEAIEGIAPAIERFDPSLAKALGKSRRKIAYQFEKMDRKVAREALRRNQRAAADVAALSGLIYPRRHLQERLYSFVPLLAKHGLNLAGRLYDGMSLDCPDHQLAVV